MIAKAIAAECQATFFSVSASSLTSKYLGESEKLVKALFEIAREKQPSIIFIDEIDSILSARGSDDNEATKRLKTEFLIAFDGVGTSEEDQILLMAATNLPQVLDEAARRRFSRRIYVPLPDARVRATLIQKLLKQLKVKLSGADIHELIEATEGFSANDLRELCKEAAMGPIRAASVQRLASMKESDLPPIEMGHLREALKNITRTVSTKTIRELEQWNEEYGTKLSVSESKYDDGKECRIS
jgi:spastin